jgi:hypothetical protein
LNPHELSPARITQDVIQAPGAMIEHFLVSSAAARPPRTPTIVRHRRQRGGQATTRAVSGYDDPERVDAERLGIRHEPTHGGVGILLRTGERPLAAGDTRSNDYRAKVLRKETIPALGIQAEPSTCRRRGDATVLGASDLRLQDRRHRSRCRARHQDRDLGDGGPECCRWRLGQVLVQHGTRRRQRFGI